MLSQVIGDLLPVAVGVALSPIPIVAMILMLGTPKARINGTAFAIGWVLGLVVVSIVVLVVAGGSDNPNSTSAETANGVKIALGVVFLFMALRRWRSRPKNGETAPDAEVDGSHRPVHAGSVLRPRRVALRREPEEPRAHVGGSRGRSRRPGCGAGDSAIAVAVFMIIGSITVAGPVLFFMFAGDHATAPLTSIKEFMGEHNAVIMMVVLLVLGAKLIGSGIGGLGS